MGLERAEEKGRVGELNTLRLEVDSAALASERSQDALHRAVAILRAGGTVAFPTETVYGLGANALDPEAVRRIFEAKQRPSWDPLIVHVASKDELQRVVGEVPPKAQLLMDAFWPGPLTLLLPKAAQIPSIVTAGRPRVGVRMPRHPVARTLIALAETPIAAPSANSFGRTSPTRAEFVLEDLDGRIDALIDSGETSLGLESTVVDATEDTPILYRPGMVTIEQLQAVCGIVTKYSAEFTGNVTPESQPSPGVGVKHYAPRARLMLVEPSAGPTALSDRHAALCAAGEVVGIMLADFQESTSLPKASLIYHWGKWQDEAELARRLFAGLRELDAAGATVILCPLPAEKGIGSAIRDRLLKAARPR